MHSPYHFVATRNAIAEFAVQLLFEIAVLWILRGLAGSVRTGSPFTMQNVRRLRWLAFLLPALDAIESFSRVAVKRTLFAAAGNAAVDALFVCLVVFTLAEVFAYGVRLREDVESTV